MAQKQPPSMARSVPKFQLSEMLESLSKGDLTAPTRGQRITRSAEAGSSKRIPSKTITALALGSSVDTAPAKNPWGGTFRSRREQCAGAAEARREEQELEKALAESAEQADFAAGWTRAVGVPSTCAACGARSECLAVHAPYR